MGFNNPGVPWSEMERRLSDRWDDVDPLAARARRGDHPGDGGDSPAWSYHREAYEAPAELLAEVDRARGRPTSVPYAELHCHSAFSFLDGASQPEALAEEAARLGLDALALTDHAGFYGVVRFAEAARALELATVFGAELTLNATEARSGPADPEGRHVLVLARDPVGYARLARDDRARADAFGRTVLTVATAVMAVTAAILFAIAPQTTRLIAPGFTGAQADLYVDLFRVMCLTPIVFAASIALGELLIAQRRFLWYALAPVLYNAGIVAGTVLLADQLGIFAAAVGAAGYLATVLGRVVGLAVDGSPGGSLLFAAVVELLLGLACLHLLRSR